VSIEKLIGKERKMNKKQIWESIELELRSAKKKHEK